METSPTGDRQRAIANGMKLLNEVELEQEIADRRGGYGVW